MELGYTALGFLSLYHDVIVLRYLQSNKMDKGSRLASDPTIKNNQALLICLSVVQNSQLLAEIASLHRWGERGRWIAVLVIEMCKLILRLALYRRTTTAILHQQKVPDRTETVTQDTIDAFSAEQVQRHENRLLMDASEAEPLKGKDQAQDKLIIESPSIVCMELHIEKTLHGETLLEKYKSTKLAPNPLQPKRGINVQIGEYLYMLRPALYLLAMYICGRKSWLPWLLSLGLDLTGVWYSSTSQDLSDKDGEELSRRRLQWCYYLLRSPFFEAIFQSPTLVQALQRWKGASSLFSAASSIAEYVESYRNYYFYVNT